MFVSLWFALVSPHGRDASTGIANVPQESQSVTLESA
jgi:hypothetical protein